MFVRWLCLSERSHNWRTRCCLSPKWIRGNERDPEGLGEVCNPRPIHASLWSWQHSQVSSFSSSLIWSLFFSAYWSFFYFFLLHPKCTLLVISLGNPYNIFQPFKKPVKLVMLILASALICFHYSPSTPQAQLCSSDLFNLFKMPCYSHPSIHPSTHLLLQLHASAQIYSCVMM